MSYKFFSDTGIQFFSDPDLIIDFKTNAAEIEEDVRLTNLRFAYSLFRTEWLPFSLDGNRNLIRIYYNERKQLIFCIDTTIRSQMENMKFPPQIFKYSLVETDITTTLEVKNEYKTHQHVNLFSKITTNTQTEKWVIDIFNRKINSPSMRGILDEFPGFKNFDPVLTYKVFIAELIRSSNSEIIPEITILADHTAAAAMIESNLYIDLGNSRTIGLVVEKDINNGRYNIHNSSPLKIINYNELQIDGGRSLIDYSTKQEIDYDYLISSKIRFKKNIFEKYVDSGVGFKLPSIICMGSEADEMQESKNQTANTGISGPKRYLWADEQEKQFWNFHSNDEEHLIRGEILEFLPHNDDDNVLNDIIEVGLAAAPIEPSYPKRVMMIFAMAELIYQAFVQINSVHYRIRTGNINVKRIFKNVVISFPTAMPEWERERLLKQAKKAVWILRKMDTLPYDINVDLNSDEATCSQVSFLYGEANRFPGQGGVFFNLIKGKRRESNIRVASLDIGGGTTDLMIADYTRLSSMQATSSDLKQKIIYSDGINLAGDDIIKHLIDKFVIERLRNVIINKIKTEDKFLEFLGAGAPDAEKLKRIEAMNGLFIPIAEFYMHYMSNYEKISKNNIQRINSLQSLNKYLENNNLKSIGEELPQYFTDHNILPETFNQFEINNLIPSISNLENEVLRIYQGVLYRFAWVISQHRPDYLILAGRTASLPVITNTLRQYTAIPPGKIISLKDYFIGPWHPFSKNGYVDDPKTSVVVGNAISHISNNREMFDVNIVTEGVESDYTLNFIGENVAGNTINQSQIIYSSDNNQNDNRTIYLQNRLNILYRNIDDPDMPCNLMYTLALDRKNGSVVPANDPIEVELNTSEPKKNLNIENVSGDIIEKGNQRPATRDDILLKEQTLLDGEYYLDNGIFGVTTR